MSKLRIAWIIVALVGLLSAVGLVWSMFGSDRLTFTAAELQSRLNQQLPRTVRDVTIDRVDVALADNRLALRIATQARVLATAGLRHRFGTRRSALRGAGGCDVFRRRRNQDRTACNCRPDRGRRRGRTAGQRSPLRLARRGRERDQGLPGDTAGLSLQGRLQGLRTQGGARRC